jgi:catechol 2,3-dioxygenase-like lactoylglutathione lyase family enzyme
LLIACVPPQDPKKSLDFYENVLGMTLLDEHDAGDFKVRHMAARVAATCISDAVCPAQLFFLGYQHQEGKSRGEREALLELT